MTSYRNNQNAPTKNPPPPVTLIDDYAQERVDYHVWQVARSYCLNEHDQEDLRQNIFLAICVAVPRYDPQKSKPRTFVSRVIDLARVHLARGIRNQLRCPARSPLLFSQLEREGVCFAPLAPRRYETAAHDLELDLRQALAEMTAPQQRLANSLESESVAEIATRCGVHRSTVYRQVAAIRRKLSDLGLDPSN